MGWAYKRERFFKYNEMLEQEKVEIASIHLKGKTLQWFKGYEAFVKELNWKTFVANIIMQLGPGTYDNMMGQITKLRQTSLV